MNKIVNSLIEKYRQVEIPDDELKLELINDIRENYPSLINIKDQYLTMETIFSNLRGYGHIDKYIKDSDVTEIMVNSNKGIYIEKGGKLIKVKEKYNSEVEVIEIIQKIVGKSGREINKISPIVDSNLDDGSRINAIFPPLSTIGPVLTIRKFKKDRYSLYDLLEMKSLSKEMLEFLEYLVVNKYNIIISGGTGTGKTTLLNSLVNLCVNERIIVIEDSREIKLDEVDNTIYLETRNKNSSGAGEINIRDLIKASLRMRPDRIVVGEVRGKEALDMLQAMNTGHEGSFSTVHANSSKDSISRLETMVLQGGEIPLKALTRQIISSVDIIIQLDRYKNERKISEISEIIKDEQEVKMNRIFEYNKKFVQVGELINKKVKNEKL